MALINCPECGKENVSETAEMCPNCGYGIKAHTDRQKKKEELKQKQQKRADLLYAELQEELSDIDSMICPEAPPPFLKYLVTNHMFGIFLIVIAFIFCLTLKSRPAVCCMGVISVAYLVFKYSPYKNDVKKHQYLMSNWDSIKERKKETAIEEYNERLQNNDLDEESTKNIVNNSERINIPSCPTCGSESVEKISLTNKVIGGALFGLFSSNVRKTMHCKNCGYKW